MKSMLRFFLWLLALFFLGVFSWAVALYLSWPSWGWAVIFFGVLGLYFGIRLLRRLWYLSRSRVKLAASEAAGRKAAEKPNGLAELTAKWKQGIATLRHSSLRRFGNPIYALPWFMVVGESGVGKTSAITRSRLASLNKSISQFEPITQTLNCDWWFFNRAVVIDTAGRYVSPDGDEAAQAEWERMLELLAKYRMKEGLNGLVVAIDAEHLMADDDELERRGLAIRERVDQLIRLFDKRFPIFVMITKSDLVYGFKEWAQALPPEALNQAMGYTGSMEQGDQAEIRFLDTALNDITERLKLLRMDMAVKGVDLGPQLLLFPEELQRLRSGLQRFLQACASNNPYLEQPLLRGLFFSSARQTGEQLPSALAHLLGNAQDEQPVRDKGLFLHDFFERVLPADRWTFLPTVIVHHWRQVTRNLAIVTWISLFIAILVFVLLSYYQTRASLLEIERVYPQHVAEEHDETRQLTNLHSILQVIDLILEREKQWQTRWLAFSPDITQLEEDIKRSYVHGYQDFLQTYSPNHLLTDRIPTDHSSPEYAEAVLGLVRTINLTKARINGADYQQLRNMPQMPPGAVETLLPGLPPAVVQVSDRMQVAYMAWSAPDDPFLRERLANDQHDLNAIIQRSPKLEWLLPWANALPGLQAVTLREFWAPGTQGRNEDILEPALTRQGDARLHSFLDELGRAVEDPTEFRIRRSAFEAWLLNERFNSWQTFAWSFQKGERLLANEPAWREMLSRVDTDASPYYRFFDRLKSEFSDVPADQLPGWLQFARGFNDMRHAATADGTLGRARGMLNTFNNVGERMIRQTVADQSLLPMTELPQSIQGIQDFAAYAQAFDEAVAMALSGEGNAYQLAADYFNYGADPSVQSSAIQTVLDNLSTFRQTSGYNHADDQVIWHLVGGPVNLLISYALEQGSCSVQKEWEGSVLWKTQQAVSVQEITDQLFGEKGSVWSFADGPAKPFLNQQAAGFKAAQKDSYTFPFNPEFIPFLNRSVDTQVAATVRRQQAESSIGQWANLLITSRPIGVNPGAQAQPYAVHLSIQCANEQVTLDNFNMAVTNSFDWSPDQCGDVTLQILIEDLTLTRRYPGPMGLARFVEEFVDGQRIFTPEDFPQAREELEALNVNTLHVRYDLVGQEKLLEMAHHLEYLAETSMPSAQATPARRNVNVPERVGQCWMDGIPEQPSTMLPLYIRQRAQQIIDQPPPPPEPPHIQALAEAEARAEAAQAPVPRVERTHRVKEGETLYSIARRFGTTVDALKELNAISDVDLIVTGRLLKLPPSATDETGAGTSAPTDATTQRPWHSDKLLQPSAGISGVELPLRNN